MQTVITINAVIMALFFVCYSYQFFYVAVALLKRKKFTCRNVLACIIFSAFSSSGTPVVDSSASVVTQVWSYLGEVVFNLLVLVGLVKSADHIAKEMLGL